LGAIGQGTDGVLDTNTGAMERASGGGVWPRAADDPTSGLGDIRPAVVIGESTGGDLNILLALLVALMLACGVAAGVTVSFALAYADDSGAGY
jgi:hypothetical protein